MRINGDGENLLRVVLADHMAVKLGDDFTRFHWYIPWQALKADDRLRNPEEHGMPPL
jgi:hypothetical protein